MNGPWMQRPLGPRRVPVLVRAYDPPLWLDLCGIARSRAGDYGRGWGLMERTSWGRIVAIIAAIVNLIKFPFGTALGIWTLLMLLGYRNNTLYDRLTQA